MKVSKPKKRKPLKIRNGDELTAVIKDMCKMRQVMREAKDLIQEGTEAIKKYLDSMCLVSLETEDIHVKFTEYEKTQFDMDAFRAEHPTLYKAYLTKVPTVRFSYGVKDYSNPNND